MILCVFYFLTSCSFVVKCQSFGYTCVLNTRHDISEDRGFHLLVGNVNGKCSFRVLDRGEDMLQNVRMWTGFSWSGLVDVSPVRKLNVS
jgi:hypothetical protein